VYFGGFCHKRFKVTKWKWRVHFGGISYMRFRVTMKIKGVFKRNLAKEGKSGKIRKKTCTQKEYGGGGLRW
jgi:hypothetical protein